MSEIFGWWHKEGARSVDLDLRINRCGLTDKVAHYRLMRSTLRSSYMEIYYVVLRGRFCGW